MIPWPFFEFKHFCCAEHFRELKGKTLADNVVGNLHLLFQDALLLLDLVCAFEAHPWQDAAVHEYKAVENTLDVVASAQGVSEMSAYRGVTGCAC